MADWPDDVSFAKQADDDPQPSYATAVFAYAQVNSDELTLKEGDKVVVLKKGADLERVGLIREREEEVNCLLNSGDVIFFDSLLLHSSQQNQSPNPRLALAACYTTADNIQFKNPYIPCYPLDVVKDDQLLSLGLKLTTSEDLRILAPEMGVESAKKESDQFAASIKTA